MANISSMWESCKNYIYKNYGQESGKMLVHAGVITWITASASQIAAVVFNDKVAPEQKKFLVPQEIADGAINVLTFYLITNSVKNMATKLVSSGKWTTKAIANYVKMKNPEIKLGSLDTNLSKIFKEDKEFHKTYDKFKGGTEMIAATLGSVVSCNAITPYIRNSWGAKRQKESLAQEHQINKPDFSTSYGKVAYVGKAPSFQSLWKF